MQGTHLKKVTFVGVTLRNLRWLGVRVEKCLFKRCTLDSHVWDQTFFEDCSFEDCELIDVQGSALSFNRADFNECRAQLLRWSEGTLSSLMWRGGSVQRGRWTLCRTDRVRFQEVALEQFMFLGGRHDSVVFHQVDATHVTLSNAELGELHFVSSPMLRDIRVVACHGQRLGVAEQSKILGLSLILSRFEHLVITWSELEQLELDECQISARMELSEAQVWGLNFLASTVVSLGLERVRLGGYITIRSGHFTGLHGRKVFVEPGLEASLSGVTYTESTMTFEDLYAQ